VNEDLHQLVSAAAELSGSSISQFLVDAAVSRAREVTEQATRITLTMKGAERMFAALENPPVISKALRAAATRHKEKNYNESHFSADTQKP
jgi:uncharacterized protein (DUF1778 family)